MSYQDLKDKKIEDELKMLRRQAVYAKADYIKALDDAYPDVGWGKSYSSCVDEALRFYGYTKEQIGG